MLLSEVKARLLRIMSNAVSQKEISIQEACNLHCHLNSAKCCQNNDGGREASAILFKNCAPYLEGELAIVKPQILVTQGRYARTAIQSLDKYMEPVHELVFIANLGFTVIVVHTSHPSAYGKYYPEKRQMPEILQAIQTHIEMTSEQAVTV